MRQFQYEFLTSDSLDLILQILDCACGKLESHENLIPHAILDLIALDYSYILPIYPLREKKE